MYLILSYLKVYININTDNNTNIHISDLSQLNKL